MFGYEYNANYDTKRPAFVYDKCHCLVKTKIPLCVFCLFGFYIKAARLGHILMSHKGKGWESTIMGSLTCPGTDTQVQG